MEYKSTISQQRIHTFTYLTLTYVFMVRRTIQYRTVNAHKNAILYHTTHMYVHMHMYPDAWAFSINYKSADRSTFTMYRTNEPRNIYDLPNERRNLPNQKPQIIYRTHEENLANNEPQYMYRMDERKWKLADTTRRLLQCY